MDTYEFRELFLLCTRILHPLSNEETRRLATLLIETNNWTLSEDKISIAATLSGGHPGILTHLCRILSAARFGGIATDQVVNEILKQDWAIRQECQRLWDELEEEEHKGLLALVRNGKLDSGKKRFLEVAGLVVAEGTKGLQIFSPVFDSFVRDESLERLQSSRRGLYFDEKTRQIWLDEKDITRDLSAEQYAILCLFCQRPGVVCRKDDIMQAVWPEQAKDGITDEQIYQLINRVREKVEPDPAKPQYIVTARGQGYQFEPKSR